MAESLKAYSTILGAGFRFLDISTLSILFETNSNACAISVFHVYRPSRKFQDACTHWQCECCLSWPPSFLMLVLLHLSKLLNVLGIFLILPFCEFAPFVHGIPHQKFLWSCRIVMSLLKTLMGCFTFLSSCNKNLSFCYLLYKLLGHHNLWPWQFDERCFFSEQNLLMLIFVAATSADARAGGWCARPSFNVARGQSLI